MKVGGNIAAQACGTLHLNNGQLIIGLLNVSIGVHQEFLR
jgi:hypothetical protein